MILILNNKCNLTNKEFLEYIEFLNNIKTNHDLVLCPSFIYLNQLDSDFIKKGSQNVSAYKNGAYTGEISALQLKNIGVEYTIVGHSERRKYQNEDNTIVNQKIKQLIDNQIIPILCVGESKDEKETGKTIDSIYLDLTEGLKDITDKDKIIIAYEPLWAIGTGETPTKEEIDNVLLKIKEKYPNNKLIYGGSVNENNIDEFKESSLINGFLLGGLSLKVDSLSKFLNRI